jgi:hypothetical protein
VNLAEEAAPRCSQERSLRFSGASAGASAHARASMPARGSFYSAHPLFSMSQHLRSGQIITQVYGLRDGLKRALRISWAEMAGGAATGGADTLDR